MNVGYRQKLTKRVLNDPWHALAVPKTRGLRVKRLEVRLHDLAEDVIGGIAVAGGNKQFGDWEFIEVGMRALGPEYRHRVDWD